MAHRVAASQTMKRTAGSKLVTATILGTVGMVGIAGIYVPFIADKDLIRGMDEDGGAGGGARQTATMLQQEIQKLQHEGILRQDADIEADADAKRDNFFKTTTTTAPPTTTPQKRGMWQYFKK